jgi:hypothetical protein
MVRKPVAARHLANREQEHTVMKTRFATALAVMALISGASIAGQSPAAPPASPSTATAGVPRTADGTPDFSGIWQVLSPAAWDLEPHHAREGVPASQGIVVGGEIPYQPWALAKRKENSESRVTADTEANCYLPGVPRLTYMPFPFQIVQTPELFLMLHEYARAIRHIHTNGTEHPKGPIEWWLGDSRGRWDGDTLIVDTVHFTNQTWLDRSGNFHSDALHVVERFTPDGPDHITYRATLEDPNVFTRPWDIETVLYRRKEKNIQLLEFNCYGFQHEGLYP